jgi:rhodanese-related sulfurtransferase
MTARPVEELLADSRIRIERVDPEDLEARWRSGALVVDIRPERQRAEEGGLGFGIIVERNVLEWRFDLLGEHALAEIGGYDREVIVVCSEGYASSFAADSLRRLGYERAADLAGGFRAWSSRRASESSRP